MLETPKLSSEEKIVWAVSTFKKNAALRGWLESAVNLGNVGLLHVADDNDGEALPVAEEYQARFEAGTYPYQVVYSTGPNLGIAVNKNRSIKFFLTSEEAKPYKYLILSDDDLKFRKHATTSSIISETLGQAFLKAHEASGFHHTTGYLGGQNVSPNADDFCNEIFGAITLKGYRTVGEDDHLYHYPMSQGMMLFFTRELLDQVGYFDIGWPSKYGYEHSLMSARCQRFMGRQPELFPILKRCHLYLECQGIPNNYEADPGPNNGVYWKRMEEVLAGVGLMKRGNPGC